ncbi:MAG: metallophosphoesterase [Candidatus Thermoplasmatota archaeon]
MDIIACSDIHGSEEGVRNILSFLELYKPQLLILCGDITHFGTKEKGMEILQKFVEKVKTIAIPGNCDPDGFANYIESTGAINLHKKKIKIEKYTFVGFGGSNRTPFFTLYEWKENETYDILDKLMEERVVLVTHAPPKGNVDTSLSVHLGSEAIAKIVQKYKPILSIAGHIHEGRGIEIKNQTTFVNPGSAKKKFGAFIKLDDWKVEAKLI